MAERAGWNTGPFDITILIFLENKRKIQINVSERSLGDCQPDAGFPQRRMRGGEGHPAGLARPGADEAAAHPAEGGQWNGLAAISVAGPVRASVTSPAVPGRWLP